MKSSTRGVTRTKRHSFLCSFVITLFYRRCWIYSFLCLCVNKNTSNEKSFIFVSLFLDADHLLSTLNMSALSFILHYNTLCSIYHLLCIVFCPPSTIHYPISSIHYPSGIALLDATHILQVLLLLGDSDHLHTLYQFWYTTAFFCSVNSTPKRRKICDTIASFAKKEKQLRVFYAKKYTTASCD